MQTLQLILIVVVFVAAIAAMYTKKLSALLALPLLAIAIAVIAGIPWNDTVEGEAGLQTLVFVQGPSRLESTIINFLFAAILAKFVEISGIAEVVIKKVSELAGDRPLILAIALYVALAAMFTTLSGLGSVIMVGSIIIPILTSVGVEPVVAGCMLLFGMSVGGCLNAANWSLYTGTFGISLEQVTSFAWIAFVVFFLMGLAMIVIEVKLGGITKLLKKKGVAWPTPAAPAEPTTAGYKPHGVYGFFACLTPLVPLVCILVFKLGINIAFTIAFVYGILTTLNKDSMQRITRAITEGIAQIAGAIFMLACIGMLLKVVMDPRVTAILAPFIAKVLPKTAIAYVVVFAICAPLTLYRGPLNLWGLGLGLGAVMFETGVLNAFQLMGALMIVGQMQGICDPTNTQNVWTASATGTDTSDILKGTIVYVWAGIIVGLIISAVMFF